MNTPGKNKDIHYTPYCCQYGKILTTYFAYVISINGFEVIEIEENKR